MQIDWFTVGAQVVNFIVLVVLLKIVLYDRIVSTIDQRRHEVAEKSGEAEQARDEAREELEKNRREREQLEQEHDRMLEEAREEVDQRKKRLLEDARREVDAQRNRWHEAVRDSRRELIQDLRTRAAHGVGSAARALLDDLAGEDLEERMVQEFLRWLESDARDDEDLAHLRGGEGSVVVRTARELSSGKRSHVSRVLRELLGERDVSFEEEPDLVSGLEIDAGGRILSWSVRGYLEGLEDDVVAELRERARSSGDAEDDATETDAAEAEEATRGS